jgi:hypothetical protein
MEIESPNSQLNHDGIANMSEESSSASRWLVWIALLLLINFLSWVFDWSFWLH